MFDEVEEAKSRGCEQHRSLLEKINYLNEGLKKVVIFYKNYCESLLKDFGKKGAKTKTLKSDSICCCRCSIALSSSGKKEPLTKCDVCSSEIHAKCLSHDYP